MTSPDKHIRVALIGCGKMGMEHLRVLAKLSGVAVVAVADPAASAELIGAALGAEVPIFADVAAMLTETRPDAVHIVTPPATHARLAIQALSAGCHVYVEKPFAPTLAEASEVFSVASSRHLTVCAGHQCIFEKPAQEAIGLLPQIGRIIHVESYFSFRMVRRTISAVDQCKDILPHAVYPLLQQLRAGTDNRDATVDVKGIDAQVTGDLYALLRIGGGAGIIQVSLSGRPIEQYQHIIGTGGSLRADFVTGSVTRLIGPGTGVGVMFTPFRRGWQTLCGATRAAFRLLLGRQSSYSGLPVLFAEFYAGIAAGTAGPMPPRDILDTVDVCERLGHALDESRDAEEKIACERLRHEECGLPPLVSPSNVLVTGGTGFLGRHVAAELRHAGFGTRVVSRRVPAPSRRVAGIEYVAADLATGLPPGSLDGIGTVVHCAAETAGGRLEHEQNSINATRQLMEAVVAAGIPQVIHVSSLAVLKPGPRVRTLLDELTPVDAGNTNRGPYVWGKAESELLMQRMAKDAGIGLRIIRPGPLVDYEDFQPPGRLGRELGPIFVAIGGRKSPLYVCDVRTAARVIRSYLQDFAAAPRLLNLTEGPPPTRAELMGRYLATRRDLRVWWFPGLLLRLLNGPAKLVQRMLLRSQQPIDLYAAFASGRYRTDLAERIIAKAGSSSIPAQ